MIFARLRPFHHRSCSHVAADRGPAAGEGVAGRAPHALDHVVFEARLSELDADAAIAAEADRARRERHGLQWNM